MAENIRHLDDTNFEAGIAKGVILVDFYADWCGPCRMMNPIVAELAAELKGAEIAKVNTENALRVTANLDVTMIPTFIVFKDGKEVVRKSNIMDKNSLKQLVLSAV